MKALAHLADRLIGLLCRLGLALSALALLVSFALVVYSVAMRYLLNQPIPWVDELVGYLLVAIVMLAAADALRRGEHIAVDIITERLGPRGRTITAFSGLIAVAVAGAALVYGGLDTVSFTQMLGIRSTGYLAVPMHIPQFLIPLGGGLLFLAAIGGLLRMLLGQPPAEETPGKQPAADKPTIKPGSFGGT
jgi:C4-dicarboxylate transporter, DctQ subunit